MSSCKISPSLLSADFSKLGQEVEALTKAGADYLHLDVMDGHFVPNITFGPGLIKAIRSYSPLPFDVHLMIAPVDAHLEAFCEAGANIVTVHPEATIHLQRTLAQIRKLGAKAGVALNPSTPTDFLPWIVEDLDLILVMSVNPGFGGQAFLPSQIKKIEAIKKLIGHLPIELQVDGGIQPETAKLVRAAGADVLVAGTAVFKSKDYAGNIAALR
ncbi:MAG: ribulose-phosphate 3-epimerase [Alphaproteobacteria bacterium]|jgi:ribulose-phosphate 3-epimerase|nr:ribulose-phosphate 3-epimerase [Alphaproteobacteria bacterium]